jgi:acyl-CoA synthetase (AMP-forming)/AMP-acid ligase II
MPQRAAFVRGQHTVTYEQLLLRAQCFAGSLRSLGIQSGERIAIVLDGDEDYLVAFYGALLVGAAAVPLCPDTRTGPLVYALAHSDASVVVLDANNVRYLDGQAALLPNLRHVVQRGDAVLERPGHLNVQPWAGMLVAPPYQGTESEDGSLAALIYTSGTTGRPKGVMLSHKNLVANVRSIVQYLELAAHDVAGMVLPFYYVYGNSVLHTHLAVGATIAHVGSMAFPANVVKELQRCECTGFAGVPATFSRLLSVSTLKTGTLPALRYVTQAGAAMTPELLLKVRERLGHVRVFVMYGQTEAAARLSYLPPERIDEKLGSAGIAIPGVTLKICDGEGRERPRGELGEVVAQGDNVMLGYLQDPEATARVLRPEGLRTGDIGVMDEEGFLFLKGRESELIKSGGHRISPLEVEAALASVAGVREVAVCGLADELLGEAVAAFVVEDAPLTKRQLLDACFQNLPKFKTPTQFYVIGDLPRGATGKLLRAQLKERVATARKL